MMILPCDKGSVAEWLFEDKSVQRLTWPFLENVLVSCRSAISVLSTYELLFPKTVCLSQWMQAGECEVAQSKRVDKPDINVSVQAPKSFVDIFSLCRLMLDNESIYPLKIKIFGSGVIISEQGNSVVDNLVWIRARTMDTFDISVITQSDVWLPFSLKGEPQHNICRLNAARLTKALQNIEQQTGFILEEGLESYYASVQGFHLDNLRYADGSIADVSDIG